MSEIGSTLTTFGGKAAATGAAIGSVIPGIGTIIGATVGAVIGNLKSLFGKVDKLTEPAIDAAFSPQVLKIIESWKQALGSRFNEFDALFYEAFQKNAVKFLSGDRTQQGTNWQRYYDRIAGSRDNFRQMLDNAAGDRSYHLLLLGFKYMLYDAKLDSRLEAEAQKRIGTLNANVIQPSIDYATGIMKLNASAITPSGASETVREGIDYKPLLFIGGVILAVIFGRRIFS